MKVTDRFIGKLFNVFMIWYLGRANLGNGCLFLIVFDFSWNELINAVFTVIKIHFHINPALFKVVKGHTDLNQFG